MWARVKGTDLYQVPLEFELRSLHALLYKIGLDFQPILRLQHDPGAV